MQITKQPDRATSIGSIVGPIALALLSTILAVFLCEAGYRVARNFVCLPVAGGFKFFRQQAWGWTHMDKAAGWMHGCIGRRFEWQTYVTINDHGLRDVPRAYARRPGVSRVLLLGDSMTEAIQVPIESTFSRIVEARYSSRIGQIEVINGGHGGYGTDNELLFYREQGVLYKSDVVILVFNFSNDVYENLPSLYARAYASASVRLPQKPHFAVSSNGTLALKNPAFSESSGLPGPTIGDRIYKSFYIVRFIDRILFPPRVEPVPELPDVHHEIYLTPRTAEWAAAWELTFALIRQMRSEVEAAGSRFAVVLMPSREMVNPDLKLSGPPALAKLSAADLNAPRDSMRDFLSSDSIAFIDLSPHLQSRNHFFAWDPHLKAAGHEAISEPLLRFISQQLSAL